MQAAVGCAQLQKIQSFIEKRKYNWQYLRKGLDSLKDKLILPEAEENSQPSWFGFIIAIKKDSGLERNKITKYLEDKNIQTRLLFSGNLIKHPCFDLYNENIDYKVIGELQDTDYIMNNAFWIGVYPGMSEDMLDYMIKCIYECAA